MPSLIIIVGLPIAVWVNYNRAIKDCNRAIELKYDYAEPYSNRGAAYRNVGDYNRAIENYNKAIELNSRFVEPFYNRGVAYHERHQYDLAIKDYTMAIELKPELAEAYTNRGVAYSNKGEYERAIVDYNKAVGLKPELAEAYYNRGNAHHERREFAQSIKDYNKTIELKPELAEAYYNRGEVWLHLGEWEKAKSDLANARNMGINIITAFDYLYESVADFEQSNGVKVPEDIMEMLTSQVIAAQRADLQQQVIELIEQLSAEKLKMVVDYLADLQDKESWEATHELGNDPEIAKSLETCRSGCESGKAKALGRC